MAKQLSKNRHKDDLCADVAEVGSLLAFAASFRGQMHYAASTVRQDCYALGADKNEDECNWLIAAIADGVSEADQSHFLAEYITRQTILLVKDELNAKGGDDNLTMYDWTRVARKITSASQSFCKKQARGTLRKGFDAENLTPAQLLRRWASTLEFIVVGTKSNGRRPYASVSIAGDGAVYVIRADKGWRVVKSGKKQTGVIASNAVAALPADQGPPELAYGFLEDGDMLFITTDGLGDAIGDGYSALGGFLQNELPGCEDLISFIRIMDVSIYQADDDRTGILIKEKLREK